MSEMAVRIFCSFSLMLDAAMMFALSPSVMSAVTAMRIVFFISFLPFLGFAARCVFFCVDIICYHFIIFFWLGLYWGSVF